MGKIGIIGGSGLYNIEGIKNIKQVKIETPFGDPSDEYATGVLEGKEIVFLARHGKGHRIMPSELNFRANIYGMKKLGVDTIISVGAVGSLKKEWRPMTILVPDQFVDRTNQARKMTFFGDGIVVHIAFANPVCGELSKILYESGKESGAQINLGGTYLNMEGPAFSTRAESLLYKSWGMDVIGMTNMAEARLAREAEICYATLAMVTDYDCWYEGEESVTVNLIIQNLMKNVETAKKIIVRAVSKIGNTKKCSCSHALKDAIITDPKLIPQETKKKLGLIISKYVK